MNKMQAQTYLRGFAKVGTIRLTRHCRSRMKERDATTEDMLQVLMWGQVLDLKENLEHGNWECVIKGKDIDSEELTFVVAICIEDNLVLCITVK